MARKKEDEFTPWTKTKIRDMAGNCCSFPECRKTTVGAKKNRSGRLNIGVACHIKAASPNGPRYDPDQSSEQRSSHLNGIWMCGTHSVLVDADDSAYSVKTLVEWKRLAEERANALVDVRMFSASEMESATSIKVMRGVRDFIKADMDALTPTFPQYAEVYKEALNELDPRFDVDIQYGGGTISHRIKALEPDLKLNFAVAPSVESKVRELYESGEEITLSRSEVAITGSPLFDRLQATGSENEGFFTFSGPAAHVESQLYAHDSSKEHLIYSFPCKLTVGARYLKLQGRSSDSVIDVKVSIDVKDNKSTCEFGLSFASWQGLSINKIPYFARHVKAADIFSRGDLKYVVEINGRDISITSGANENARNLTALHVRIVSLVSEVRRFFEQVKLDFVIVDLTQAADINEMLNDYAPLLKGPRSEAYVQEAPIAQGAIAMSDEAFSAWRLDETQRFSFLMEREPFNVFGTLIKPPALRYTLEEVFVRLYSDIDTKAVKFYAETGPNTVCAVEIDSPEWKLAS
ncbi:MULTISPECIES: hypothetical protein [Pseudomonas]|uniref:hypothetical protein n=1 Tax=Pseudomonas TaxID=286 RepID=UPI002B40758A|nr:hypothetical protein [Pseudomonas sichuanensis]